MADIITLAPSKDASLRRDRASGGSTPFGPWEMAKGEQHLLAGRSVGQWVDFASLIQFDIDWYDIKSVIKAELVLYTADDHAGITTRTQPTTTMMLRTAYKKTTWSEAGGNEEGWASGTDDNVNGLTTDENFKVYGHVSATPSHENVYNITTIVKAWAPASVLVSGAAGLGKANNGLVMLQAGSADTANNDWVVGSKDHPNTSLRPFLRLTVDRKGGPGQTVLIDPVGNIPESPANMFVARYEPGRAGNKMSAYSIELRETAGGPNVWPSATTLLPDSNEVVAGVWQYPIPSSLKTGIDYLWRARTKNNVGEWTPWTAEETVRLTTNQPTLGSPIHPNNITVDNLKGVYFQVTVLDSNPRAQSYFEVQVRSRTLPTDPTWADTEMYWDSGRIVVPAATPIVREGAEGTYRQELKTLYKGSPLPLGVGGGPAGEGRYSFRIRSTNTAGGVSTWSYNNFTITKPYDPNSGYLDFMTGYGRKRDQWRIVIKEMKYSNGTPTVGRGPGRVVATLTDASSAGASEFYNAAGEFFFTLPVTHPQASAIEPYQTHWALEMYRGEGWREENAGLVIDFDATEDEVVFYGTDYLGLLMMAQEERYDPQNADLPTEKGGGKYVQKSIKTIITDQLQKAKAVANSPVGFIEVGDIVAMDHIIDIYSSFKARLPFIAGLLDSHRAGTGKRTRIICEKGADAIYRWRVVESPGTVRDNLRMEYGGLIQGFRAVPFGDFGTSLNAIGRTATGAKTFYHKEVAPGISPTTWGSFPQSVVYQDLADLNDLRRRARQQAMSVSKVGKQMALGIRVGTLDVKDGWDITDDVPIVIKRGVVDTTRWGSHYWTIWGWSWTSYADGHYDLDLSIAPRQDTTPPDPNLIPSIPILDIPGWQVSDRPPTVDDDAPPGGLWYDGSTGDIWEMGSDGLWTNTGENMTGPPGADGPPGPTGPPGPPGATMYTWVKYADNAVGDGLTDDPTGKAYIGFAYNKTTPTESVNPADYAWSPNSGASGPPGPAGPAGETLYTWTKYADDAAGAGMSDSSTGKAYLGLAFNKPVAAESTNPADYQWSKVLGPVGPVGGTGPAGADGTTLYTWTKYADNAAGAGLSDSPTGKAYMGTATNKTTAVESTNPADYTWVKVLGDTGGTGPAGPGFDLTAPAVPTGLVLDTGLTQQTDGSLRPFISAQWDIPVVAGNLSHWEVGYTHAYPNQPKGWLAAVSSPGGLAPGTYDVVVTALGKSGGESDGLSAPVNIPEGTTGNIVLTGLAVSGGLTDTFRVYVGLKDVGTGVAVPRQAIEVTGATTTTVTSLPVAPAPVVPVASTAIDYATEVVAVEPKPLTGTKADNVYNDVRGATYFSVRVQAVSQANVRSGWCTPVTKVSTADNDAPPMPTGVEATDGNKRIGVSWYQQPDTADLDRYEVRWREVNAVTPTWNYFDIYGTFAIVEVPKNRPDGVDPNTPESEVGVAYEGNVRAIDRSGNVNASHTPGTETAGVANVTDLDAGWSVGWNGQSLPTMPEDIAFRNLFAEKGQFITLTADKVVGGDLSIREDTDSPGSITIYDLEGRMAGRWSPYGWYLINPANAVEAIRGYNGVISFTKSGETDIDGNATAPWTWAEAVWTTGIGPDGINADYITTGAAQGGANRIINSGFELTPLSVPGSFTFDTAAEWDASVGATTNRTAAVAQFTQTLYTVP